MENFSLKKLLFRNAGIQLTGQVVCLLIGLVTTFVLSRYLGVARFGGLNYIFAFYYFFFVLQDMGIDVVVIRECSKNPEQTALIIGTMRSYKIIVSLFFMGIAWVIIRIIPYSLALKPSLFVYSFILPILALEHPAVAFQINLNVKYSTVNALLKTISSFIFLVTLIAAGLGMTGYVLALVLSEVIVLVSIHFFSRRFVRPLWTIDWKICRMILKSGFVLAAMGVFVSLINRIDFIMLERMTDLNQVGFYAAVYKITNLLEVLPLTVMGTLYPVMSRYAHAKDKTRLRIIHWKSFFLLAAIALPLGIGVTLFAGPITRLIFGAAFLPSAAGLRVLIWATVFLYLAITSGNLLISLGCEKITLAASIAAAAINIVLNFFWIPRYGFVGAAYATVASFFTLFIVNLFSASRILKD